MPGIFQRSQSSRRAGALAHACALAVLAAPAAYGSDRPSGTWSGTITHSATSELHNQFNDYSGAFSVTITVLGTRKPDDPVNQWQLTGTYSETYSAHGVSRAGCTVESQESLSVQNLPIQGFIALFPWFTPPQYTFEAKLQAPAFGSGLQTTTCPGRPSPPPQALTPAAHVPPFQRADLVPPFDPLKPYALNGTVTQPTTGGQVVTTWTLRYDPPPAEGPQPGPSGHAVPDDTDTTFVTSSGSGIDTRCTFREGGPLEIRLRVTRVVGPVDADGRLSDRRAITTGALWPRAVLRMPAFDVDSVTGTLESPEVDLITFNGEPIYGTRGASLHGENDAWTLNEFDVPVELIRFPDRGQPGNEPEPRENVIRIAVDEGTTPASWCTAIDWASLTIGVVSPAILVHGNNSDAGFWDRHGFSAALERAGLLFDGCAGPCDNALNLQTSSIDANGAVLATRIPALVRSFGAKRYHIVAHSKGGLDSRHYLAARGSGGPELLSLTTLSTPHEGSVLADLSVARGVSLNVLRSVRFVGFPAFAQAMLALSNLTGPDAGARDLTTERTRAFNHTNVSQLPPADYNRIAADADRNGSGDIDLAVEIAALKRDNAFVRNAPAALGIRGIDVMYQILRNTQRVDAIESTEAVSVMGVVLPLPVLTLVAVPSASPLPNDVLVTFPSGLGHNQLPAPTRQLTFTGPAGRNHSDVADGGVADAVIPWLLETDFARGGLKPSGGEQ